MTNTKRTSLASLLVVAVAMAGLFTADLAVAQQKSQQKTATSKSKTLYRYRNDRGVLVVDDNVPPEMAKNGYDVITATGTLIERVAPQLTEEQLAEQEAERAAAAEKVRIAEWETSLKRRYRSVEEIEAARDRVMKEFDNQLEILRGNLVSQRSQVEAQQQRAADLERRGRPVYQSIQDNIAVLQKEIATTEATIALRQEEIAQKRAEFDADIAQFRKIIARSKPKTGSSTSK